ncbi:MAG: hypothetical protein J7501_13780 [Bdellovibrio sp.]|nr:hypothetical protein [Bdellovibrio sp.]
MKKRPCPRIICNSRPLFAPFLGHGERTLAGHLRMRHLQIWLMVLTLMAIASLSQAASFCDEVFTQKAPLITQRVVKNDFVTNRHLDEYLKILHPDFANRLTQMTSKNHWVDLGAGKATAQIEFIKTFSDRDLAPQATAVAFKIDRWWMPSLGGKLKTQEGAFEAQPTSTWQKAELVTDVYGVLSYTADLGRSLQKTFDMMSVQGELYILALPYGTEVRIAGKGLSLTEFLQTIPGLKVEGSNSQIKVTKTQETIQVPLLNALRYTDGGPPLRLFEMIAP